MTYMRVDVSFPGCLKAIRSGGDALWMWLAMKAYAKKHGTDGFVPAEAIGRLEGPKPGSQKRLVQRLIDAKGESGKHGLVDLVDGGYQLHDYLDHEESAEQAEQKKAAAKVRKQRYDAKHRPSSNSVRNGVTDPVTNSELTPALPNQTKPNQANGGRPHDPMARIWDPPEQREDVAQVWAEWCREFDKPNAQLGHKRAEVIAECLDQGSSLEDITVAFRGARLDDWVSSKGFQVSLILGDRERFEYLVDLGTGRTNPPAKARAPQPTQPNHGRTGWENAKS